MDLRPGSRQKSCPDDSIASEGSQEQLSYVDMLPSLNMQSYHSSDASSTPNGTRNDESQSQRQGKVRFSSSADEGVGKGNSLSTQKDSPSPTQELVAPQHDQKLDGSESHSLNGNALSPSFRKEILNPFADPIVNLAFVPQATTNMPRNASKGSTEGPDEHVGEQNLLSISSQDRAQKVVASQSGPASRRSSIEDIEDEWRLLRRAYPVSIDDIPMADMYGHLRTTTTTTGEATSDEEEKTKIQGENSNAPGTHRSVDAYTKRPTLNTSAESSLTTTGFTSGQTTPVDEKHGNEIDPNFEQYRGGILFSLLKLYNSPEERQLRRTDSSCSVTPSTFHTSRKSRKNKRSSYNTTKSHDTLSSVTHEVSKTLSKGRLCMSKKRMHSTALLGSARSKLTGRPRLEDEIRITVHIAETLSRQNYLLKLCRALMKFGAPTHRLEEYMKMSARVLEVHGQFLYLPGCMIISFDESATQATEVKLVKAVQDVDLGLLQDIHEIYKEVIHDVIGVEEATQRLDRLNNKKPKNSAWARVIVHGLASASVAPFAFEGRYIDMPFCFLLGCILGFLQLIVAPRSELYSNIFEITASVLTSFLARAFGSIQGGNLFCFSAMAQSSIALILPGYMVLCGALELQSRLMVAGSVRMVYAIIYSLFLGFGITIGTTFYGLLDMNATTATTCAKPGMSEIEKWAWVPVFTLCLCFINQAKWQQTPVMLIIAFAGFVVNSLSARSIPSTTQISNTLGALAVGVLGNLYSRMRHGVAAAALLPAIFVQVPSGLAASGSLLAGLSSAEKIVNTTSSSNMVAEINGTNTVAVTSPEDLNTIVFNVGYRMIQIAVGITVGLFMSALLVYPFGKRRSGLFTL